MVRYSLTCADGHAFDSWFQSAAAYDDLAARGLLACAECGSGDVAKALMAPAVAASVAAAPDAPQAPITAPRSAREAALAAMRRHLDQNADYVGPRFAAEARRIHAGDAPDRHIWGEAGPAEARELLEEGIPVAPLPFLPTRKAN